VINKTLSLTLAQEDIFFDQLLFQEFPGYNIGAKVLIQGQLDIEKFSGAYQAFVSQHDVLRFVLKGSPQQPSFKQLTQVDTLLHFLDYSHYSDANSKLDGYIANDFRTPFKLFNEAPLFNFSLFRLQEREFVLYSKYHHLIVDGWATSVLFQRLVEYYNQIVEHGKVVSQYDFPYERYIATDRQYLESEEFISSRKYWLSRFETVPETPFVTLGLATRRIESRRHVLHVKRAKYDMLIKFARDLDCSTVHVILGVLFTYLTRFYHNDDHVIGMPILNRTTAFFKKTVGLFAGMTAFRMRVDTSWSFERLVKEIKAHLRIDYRHQRFPLGKLVRDLPGISDRSSLFNFALSYEKHDYSPNFTNTLTTVTPLSHFSERLPLTIYVREFDACEDVKFDFDYNTQYYGEVEVQHLAHHVEMLVDTVINKPNQEIQKIDFAPPWQKSRIRDIFNHTERPYRLSSKFYELIDEQASYMPNKVALYDCNHRYTYREIKDLTDKYARRVDELLVGTDRSPIAVLLDRTAHMVLALIAIAKSGRGYIPLDPSFPRQRLSYILKQSKATALLFEDRFDELLDLNGLNAINFKEVVAEPRLSSNNYPPDIGEVEIAYIIYTSGSTGDPKGVKISHRSLVNFLMSMQEEPGIKSGDVLFAVTTYSFDISILEFFLPLVSGATVYIASSQELTEPEIILRRLFEVKPTVIQATPSFYQWLYHAGWRGDSNLKVLCGGDTLNSSLAKKLIETNAEVWNMYGPTETTIWSTVKRLNSPEECTSIGHPIANTEVLILDDALNIVPIGSKGTIFIGGDGLAEGYHHRPDLTAERFITLTNQSNKRVYNTGDMGKWNTDGDVQFIGRSDNQVKIRGYRIELADVEHALLQVSAIEQAVVICVNNGTTDSALVAYVKALQPALDEQQILSELRKLIPPYMIPATIVQVDDFPLTPNHKIDRKALAKRNILAHQQSEISLNLSSIELKVLACWKRALGVEIIDTHATFFENGGHSVNAVLLWQLLKEQIGANLSLRDIFNNPSLQQLAMAIMGSGHRSAQDIPKSDIRAHYPVSFFQLDLCEACLLEEVSSAYNMHLAYELDGEVDSKRFEDAVNKLIWSFEVLRSNIIWENESPAQIVRSTSERKFSLTNYFVSSIEEAKEKISMLINEPFDLENDLLIRVEIIHAPSQRYLVFTAHHIFFDGQSLSILIDLLTTHYNDSKHKVDESIVQYKDYTLWLATVLKDEVAYDKAAIYWHTKMNGYVPVPIFSLQKSTPSKCQKVRFAIDGQRYKMLKLQANAAGSSLFSLLATSVAALIFKMTNHKDFCLSVPFDGRNHSAVMDAMGMFINTLPLRFQLGDNPQVMSLCRAVNEQVIAQADFSSFPYSAFRKSCGDYHLDILINYMNAKRDFTAIDDFDGFKLQELYLDSGKSRFPFVINITDQGGQLRFDIELDQRLEALEGITIVIARYRQILDDITQKPISTTIADLDAVLPEERALWAQRAIIDFDF
jgi:amino acid adenylation domain-containing protein